MLETPRHRHSEVLERYLPAESRLIADIGCGDGAVARLLTRRGARVLGLDPSPGQIARAVAGACEEGLAFVVARAEQLPLAPGRLDAAIFFNALHHVPPESQAEALKESHRALRPGGLLYIQEPVAAGPHFEVNRPIDDETRIRAAAYEALQAACRAGDFRQETEFHYTALIAYPNFEALKDKLLAIDPARAQAMAAHEDQVRTAFLAKAEYDGETYRLAQPCRLNLLRRRD